MAAVLAEHSWDAAGAAPPAEANEPLLDDDPLLDLLDHEPFLASPLPVVPAPRWVSTSWSRPGSAGPRGLRPGSAALSRSQPDLAGIPVLPDSTTRSLDLSFRDVLLAVHGQPAPLPSMETSALMRKHSVQELIARTGPAADLPLARRRPTSAAPGPREVAQRRELLVSRSDVGSRYPSNGYKAYLSATSALSFHPPPPPEPLPGSDTRYSFQPWGGTGRKQREIRRMIQWSQSQRREVRETTAVSAAHFKGFSPARALALVTRGAPAPVSPAGPAHAPNANPSRPQSAAPGRPQSAAPGRPASAGPARPQSAGPSPGGHP
eukprot:tig00021352_g20682.t1